jgi:hypothetical protein
VSSHLSESTIAVIAWTNGSSDRIGALQWFEMLGEVTIHPVSLGLGEKRHRRGRPRLASRQEADSILNTYATLSERYLTRMTIQQGIATGLL